MRSSWKGNFIKEFKKLKKGSEDLTNYKSSIITKSFVGIRVLMHLGKEYKTFKVSEKMLGFRFGEFLKTKKEGKDIHKKKKKKKKKKN